MKIAAKISLGFATLIALIVTVLVHQLSLFYQMQSINQNLSEINFRAAILSLDLLRDLDQAEEFTRKFYATGGDPGYASQVKEMREGFAEGLHEIQSLNLSGPENKEVTQLSDLWNQLEKAAAGEEQALASQSPDERGSGLSGQLTLFSRIRIETQTVIRVTRLAIESQVQESARAGQRAQHIAWGAAAAALVLSLMVSFWIIRSISAPLRLLAEGTRAVAAGKFFYHLDDTGGDELAQLAGDFNVMTRRLGELDEMKKDFVSHVSHELKTPLASMQEAVRLLLDEVPGPLNEQQKRFLELNLQSSRRLSSMIGNLLDVSRMEAGVMQYEIKGVDLAALTRTALAEFEAPAKEKGLRLDAQLPGQPVMVDCDGDRMIQVLGNLLGNALKFSPRGGGLCVTLTHLGQVPENLPRSWREKMRRNLNGGSFALFSVADAGPGVPASEKEKIFEKFHQVRRNGSGAVPGAGLGLAIGRTIVEAHRGAIWVEDNPNGGSIFYVLVGAGHVAEPARIRTSSPI